MRKIEKKLRRIYDALDEHFGDLKWWPAETDFEVIVGAVLTQNTAWRNVEKAIDVLKRKGLVDPCKIVRVKNERLSGLIRSAGYHRLKARRLKEVSRFVLLECGGDLGKLKRKEAGPLRENLLKVNGIGPETADAILLYALKKAVFVVDAYTKRIFSRHGLVDGNAAYDEVQSIVLGHFPLNRKMLGQFHALIVETAKNFCKKKTPLCDVCPLCEVGGRYRDC